MTEATVAVPTPPLWRRLIGFNFLGKNNGDQGGGTKVAVPALAGQTKDYAITQLTNLGLKPTAQEETSTDQAKGNVTPCVAVTLLA